MRLPELNDMAEAQLCTEIATRRGLISNTAHVVDAPYIGWHDAVGDCYDIRYCTEPAAAWELIEWARKQHLIILMQGDYHFPEATVAYATKEKPLIKDEHGWQSDNVKRAWAEAVCAELRRREGR
jgi:hypothetical protein